jgi:hypothetical protein
MKFSDSPRSDHLWQKLRDKTNPELTAAFRDLYSIYDSELPEWFESLYDHEIGGFYYSPSARDNDTVIYNEKEYKLLPDIESTWQTLDFVKNSGIAEGYADPFRDFLPKEMQKRMLDFAYNMQDSDGYYYHKQWGKDITASRKGRDLGSARGVIKVFGGTPKYSSIIDSEVKKEVVTVPDHLSSRSKYIDYLDSLDIPNQSYHAGNTLSSQFGQIAAQGFTELTIDYLNKLQHPETGHWHTETNYYAINGLMKITVFYKNAKVLIPNAKKGAYAAIDAISSDEPCTAVTQIWNTWYATRNIISTMRLFGDEGNAVADEILNKLYRVSAPAIRKTAEKTLPMKKPGSSFSYGIDWPCIVSQGSPVCIPHLPEGDVNATVMGGHMMTNVVFTALELGDYEIPLFGREEGTAFLGIINSKIG